MFLRLGVLLMLFANTFFANHLVLRDIVKCKNITSSGHTGFSSTWSSCCESPIRSISSDSSCSRGYLHTHIDYINNFQSTRQKNFRFTSSRQKMQSRNALRYINRPLNCNRLFLLSITVYNVNLLVTLL